MQKIKVLILYPNEFYGPEMTVYAQIIRHLDRSRFAVYLAVSRTAAGALGVSEADGVIIRRWTFGTAFRGSLSGGLRSLVRLPASIVALARYCRREGIDIIQCASTPRSASLGLALATLAGARLLVHYHVIPGRYAGLRQVFENLVARRADRAVTVSRFLAEQVPSTGIAADKVDVVVNGVDLERFHPGLDGSAVRQAYGIAPAAPVMLQLARIIQQKRQEDVVRAFAIARRSVPNLRCLLVGWEDPRYTGPFPSYKAELEHIANEEQLGDSLIISPARPDAPQVVAAADMIVMPALGDAWNLAVTEAMATAKPVIGAASGGIPEQIVDGVTGFLVPPEDPARLAEKMIVLAQDVERRKQMGQAARLRAETYFGEASVAAGFAPIYEALVRTKPPTA